eukprot:403353928
MTSKLSLGLASIALFLILSLVSVSNAQQFAAPTEPPKYWDTNDIFIVSFREKYYTKLGVKQLCHMAVKDQLKKQSDILTANKISIKFFSTYYGVFQIGSHKDLMKAVDFLKSRDEVLAIEYRNEFNAGPAELTFGDHISPEEQSKFVGQYLTSDMILKKPQEIINKSKEQEKAEEDMKLHMNEGNAPAVVIDSQQNTGEESPRERRNRIRRERAFNNGEEL